MQLHVVDDKHIRLEIDGEHGLEVIGDPFGPLQMMAASLALCTASVMQDYAATAHFHLHHFAVVVVWDYTEQPYRVGHMQMTLQVGPDVPPSRQKALLRAAQQCTVHNTLTHGARIEMTLEVPGAEQA
ncbi:MAG TPA: OsmC family protein [Herpetosiphonaceae bacterium]